MLIAGDRERLTGTVTAVPITAALLIPVAGAFVDKRAKKATIQVITGPVFMTRGAQTPGATVGEVLQTGDYITVYELLNLQNLRFAHTSTTWAVEVTVSYPM